MSSLYYKKTGSGPNVILIHGFPMNHEVWNDMARRLSEQFTVFTPDLPGFGKSEALPLPFTIPTVATQLLQWITSENIQDPVLVGHSLGGYVALSMVEQQPSLFKGLVLFHSTALPDNEEKKESRTKVVDFIKSNGVEAFTSNFLNPLFTDGQHPAIEALRRITTKAHSDTVIGYTLAMRDRKDTTGVYTSFKNPVLLLAGAHDKGIPVESLQQQSTYSDNVEIYVLSNSAHMGMFEQPEESLTVVKSFFNKLGIASE